jgi:uncharacterized membrane protein
MSLANKSQHYRKRNKMFLYNLMAPLVFIAVFSLPALLLELQLLVIGFNFMSANVMIATAIIGLLSAIGAVVIEMIEG